MSPPPLEPPPQPPPRLEQLRVPPGQQVQLEPLEPQEVLVRLAVQVAQQAAPVGQPAAAPVGQPAPPGLR